MKTTRHLRCLAPAALCLLAASPLFATSVLEPWVGTWGVAAQPYSDNGGPNNRTLRQIVHTSIAGTALRATFSNAYGDGPLTLSNVHVAVVDNGSTIKPETDRVLTFNGLPSVTVPAGTTITSDGLDYPVPATANIAVSFYIPTSPTKVTGHSYGKQLRYEGAGNVSTALTLDSVQSEDYEFLTNVDVQSPGTRGAVVAIGASVTDGFASTADTNRRWPNILANRLTAAGRSVGVINEGISGNNLYSDASGDSALKRFDRDVLDQAGVRWVMFSDHPLNDIGGGNPEATVPNVIATFQSLISHTHDHGVRFICSTLTPWEGAQAWTPDRETIRAGINAWMRSSDSTCDAVVDQDAAVHDPAQPTKLLAAYDSGDHLHPNDAGYAAMGNAINLDLFGPVDLTAVTAPQGCGSFVPGNGLVPGQTLTSCGGQFTLNLQLDGNLVLYKGQSTVLASTGTVNKDSAQLELTTTGDFVLRGKLGEELWRSGHANQTSAQAYLQGDGNLVIYGPSGPVWATNTAGQ